jgi:hypothetical protein
VVQPPGGRRRNPGDDATERGLAAPGFADEAQDFSLADMEAHIVDGMHRVKAAKEVGLDADLRPSGTGPSDHSRFNGAGVPVLFFHSGTHADYHRPSDTVDKVDAAGMARIAELGRLVITRLAEGPRPDIRDRLARRAGELLGLSPEEVDEVERRVRSSDR